MSRNIVITGASSDIGVAICNKLVTAQDRSLLHYRRCREPLDALATQWGDACTLVGADFTRAQDVDDFIARLPEVDLLVNCAGLVKTGMLASATDDELQQMWQVNCQVPVQLCRAVIPAMVARRSGVIVNISSVVATRGNRGQSLYAGTKGFLEAFSRSVAAEYGAKGVRINCVAPGPIDAGSARELLSHAADTVKAGVALKKLGTPKDVAGLVAFLCSDEASFITGKTYSVDGGLMIGVSS